MMVALFGAIFLMVAIEDSLGDAISVTLITLGLLAWVYIAASLISA
jgi:hypothetical protein